MSEEAKWPTAERDASRTCPRRAEASSRVTENKDGTWRKKRSDAGKPRKK